VSPATLWIVDVIDWRMAQRVGELVAGSPPFGGVRAASVEPLVREFAGRVSAYSGLEVSGELPALELVDRPAWIAANLRTMRPMLAPLTSLTDSGRGLLTGPLRSASGLLLGAQVGALSGMLSQRVLGQYDLALLGSGAPPRLLLLAPWVSLHEITHAVQFSGAPWLREHLGAILSELIEGLRVTVAARDADGEANGETARNGGERGGWVPDLSSLPSLPAMAELRELVERARHGELLRLTLGEDRWALVERMQATMSLIEGHAEHTMDAVGAEVLPSLPRLRAAMTRRRETRGLPWRVLERLLGLELKLRQYEIGRRFCDAVVAAGGREALALAWRGPEALPHPRELEEPSRWMTRMSVAL
jgi:coenzyme F420 biosynthesis associated uncharacterized protein